MQHDYPRMMFHRRKPPITIHNSEQERALGSEWSRTIPAPEALRPPAVMASAPTEPEPEDEQEPQQSEPDPEPEPEKAPEPPPKPRKPAKRAAQPSRVQPVKRTNKKR